MTFASVAFFAYVAVVAVAYRVVTRRLRGALLLGASYAFYVAAFPAHALVLLALTLGTYAVLMRIAGSVEAKDDAAARRWLATGVAGVIGVLAAFKYAGMGVATLNAALGLVGGSGLPVPEYIAPLGLSYVTFGLVHALVTVRRGEARVLCAADFALYVAFFPTIVAGPIKRYPEFARDLAGGGVGEASSDAAQGVLRILVGLFKKVVLAAIAYPLADPLLAYAGEHPFKVMLGICAYSFYLYWDFAGYSDMAIGVARLFGFRVIENFDRPYLKSDLQAFWRAWHISLTRIVTEYVYIPLGGNRKGAVRTALNTLVAMLVVGIWHGSAWHFVAWGAWHGVGLIALRGWRALVERARTRAIWLEQVAASRVGEATARFAGWAVTFHFVALGWALFVLPVEEAFSLYAQLGRYALGLLGLG